MKNGIYWLNSVFGKKSYKVSQAWQKLLDNNEDDDIKLILYDLSVYCNTRKSSFVPSDPYQTAFNEGARDVFLHILEMMDIDIKDVMKYTLKQ